MPGPCLLAWYPGLACCLKLAAAEDGVLLVVHLETLAITKHAAGSMTPAARMFELPHVYL